MATVFTNVGKVAIINALNEGTHTKPVYVAWGTGAGTAAITDTTLFTEASETRVVGTETIETETITDDTYQVVGLITADGTKTITNAGLFDASTSGDMYVKGDFTGVPVGAGDKIEFTVRITAA